MAKMASSDRKRQIAKAVMEIISEEGVQNVTMMKIAERIGISDAALYKHFSTKNDMLLYMIRQIEGEMITRIRIRVEGYRTPLEKLNNLIRLHFTYVEENRALPSIIFSQALHFEDPRLKEGLQRILKGYKEYVRDLVTDGKIQGSISKDVDEEGAALLLLGLLQSAIIFWTLSDYSYSLVEQTESLWESFQRSLI